MCSFVASDSEATERSTAMAIRDEILSANESYASSFTKGDLPMPPGRRFAVVTCMDARLDPAKYLGLDEGDAHVIRNAGGLVTEDALRSLIISKNLLGTEEVFVIAHTDCGMLTFSNEEVQSQLGTDIDLLAFSDLDESVRASVKRVRESPITADAVHGFVYDVRSGTLREVA
jgi:carbonic anhydrase